MPNRNLKVYLAGPMSNMPEHNFPAFFAAAKELEEQGYTVFNPAAQDLKEYGKDVLFDGKGDRAYALQNIGKPTRYKEFLKKDLCWILDEAEAIALLPGWSASPGACTEKALAEALGLEVMYIDN